ncbi:hypothetical protein H8R17_26760 [Streptomyces sp. TRM68367]|nr:hypothetical protein [Streptomyces sp. TRM68367]
MPSPSGSVGVGRVDGVGEAVQCAGALLERLRGRLTSWSAMTGARSDVQDHEHRIRTLERARWPMPTIGVLAGVAGAATGALALFAR